LGRKIPGTNLEELNILYVLHTFTLLSVFELIGCEGAEKIFYNMLIFRSLLRSYFDRASKKMTEITHWID
jgi:hypothetical protein